MWIGLTKTRTNKELWASQYEMDEEQLMPLFTKVVQTIAGNLDIKFSGEEIMNIEKDMTKIRSIFKLSLCQCKALLCNGK